MCTQKPPNDYSQQLYDKYREAFEKYINATVSSFACRSPLMLPTSLFPVCRCCW